MFFRPLFINVGASLPAVGASTASPRGEYMSKEYDLLKESFESIKDKIPYEPDVALVLGSGLSHFPDDKTIDAVINYSEVKNFPVSKVAGHKNRFLFFKVGDKKVVCMQGRIHHYEGYSTTEVIRPTRLMKMMGAKILFLSNAAGGMNDTFNIGDLMIITDHISFFVRSPLIGENIEEFGERFPDVSKIYTKEYVNLIKEVAKEQGVKMQEGIYTQITGPAYETPAEVRLLHLIKTDAVGMSTVVEAIAAAHMGMKVCGISLITDVERLEGHQEVVDHEQVLKVANEAEQKFIPLVAEVIRRM